MNNVRAVNNSDRLKANKKKLNILLRNQDRNNDKQLQDMYNLKKKQKKEKNDFARKIKCFNKQNELLEDLIDKEVKKHIFFQNINYILIKNNSF